MRIVGEHLQTWAEGRKVEYEKDVFARSAFNRFYYASFLITREMLGELKPEWKKTAHKNIPDLLQTTVKKSVNNELKNLYKKGIVSLGEKSALQTSINGATSELSNLLKEAYELRVTADYDPEVPIISNNKVLELRKYKLNSAREWPGKASAFDLLPKNRTMTRMRFPVTLAKRKSHYEEEAFYRRTNYRGYQRA